MKNYYLLFIFLGLSAFSRAQVKTANDGDWDEQAVVLLQTPEAGIMIRSGDIDNLGFGWAEGFNPFTGKSTEAHDYPFSPEPDDASGTDRIMTGSHFGKVTPPCGGDGYSGDAVKPQPVILSLTPLKNVAVRDAILILFIDDFQSPSFCSRFQIKLNGKRFIEMEKQLNAIDQTGPVGKMVMMKFTTEMTEVLQSDKLTILIDDPVTGAADGYAIDFAKLIVNTKDFEFKGNITGRVINKDTDQGIGGAVVKIPGFKETTSNNEGYFWLKDIPAGLANLTGEAKGFASESVPADVIAAENSDMVLIVLKPSATVEFTGKVFREGESVVMNKIQFTQGSSMPDETAKGELDKISAFLTDNPGIEIELSGHTSSEGSAESNRLLSLRRVQSCKAYIVGKGIEEGRITNVGHGPDRPISSNQTEEGRAQNRRVEMRITRVR